MRIRTNLARRLATSVAALLTTGAIALSAPLPAAAGETFNGQCENAEICLYYYRDFQGAIADIDYGVGNYAGWHFYASNLWLDNNTMSAWNRWLWGCPRVHADANYGGDSRIIRYQVSDLNVYDRSTGPALNNRVTSHRFWAGVC